MSGAANSPGLVDAIARVQIRGHAEAIKGLREEQRDLKGDLDRVEDKVSEVRRQFAEVLPFIVRLQKLAYVATVGVLGVLGAEVWRLIVHRP